MTNLIRVPFADNGDRVDVPVTQQDNGSVSYSQGYTPNYELDPLTDPSARRVERTSMNQLFFDITSALREIQVNGVSTWITAEDNAGAPFSYGSGALVGHNGDAWLSLQSANTDEPGTSVKWSKVSSAADLQLKANLNGDVLIDFFVRNNGEPGAAVNNTRLTFVLRDYALVGGNVNNTFSVKDGTISGHAVNLGQLNTKAAVGGNAQQPFAMANSGTGTAGVNNDRLNFVLAQYAAVNGNQFTQFNVGGATAGSHAVRLDQFTAGTNVNGAWVKLPGGAMWCRHNLTLAANATTQWNYAASFPSAPAVFITAINGPFQCWLNGIGPANCGIFNNGAALNVNLLAIY